MSNENKFEQIEVSSKKYRKLLNVIKLIIDDWDPAEIIKANAEFGRYTQVSGEIAHVLLSGDNISVDDLALSIYHAMNNALEDYFLWATEDDSLPIAQRILDAVNANE